jgi:hypothetical protein
MSSSTRLKLSVVMIMLSVFFAVLVAQNPPVASAVATGYVAVLLTFFVLANTWKKP